MGICSNVHFKKIILPHTDESLGNCSYLDTCRHMEYCKFIHYKIDEIDEYSNPEIIAIKNSGDESKEKLIPMQWINCDLRNLDLGILNPCDVIMLDPPWDIHMNVNPLISKFLNS
jgi:mRNA m6A methyltransferase catalytic subunit